MEPGKIYVTNAGVIMVCERQFVRFNYGVDSAIARVIGFRKESLEPMRRIACASEFKEGRTFFYDEHDLFIGEARNPVYPMHIKEELLP